MSGYLTSRMALAGLLVCLLPGCAAVTAGKAATDVAVFAGTTAAKGVYGAGRLVVRGTAAGVRRLRAPSGDFPAGATVCIGADGEVYALAREDRRGRLVCP